jgi:hypothetical protein
MIVDRVTRKKHALLLLAVGIAAVTVLYSPVLRLLMAQTLTWPILWKICAASLITALPAFPMGMLLPAGMRKITEAGFEYLVPWCWAANGAASVFASILVIIMGMMWGFSVVFEIGGALYLVAGMLYLKLHDAAAHTKV